MKVNIKRFTPTAKLPFKKYDTDCGWDLYADRVSYDEQGNIVYHLGIGVEIPKGYVGIITPRSSNANKTLALSNSIGIIDCGYTGEITAKFKPTGVFDTTGCMYAKVLPKIYGVGERVCQLFILPYPEIEWNEVEELDDTERGNGGYGHTGK